jgi:hypothetical protein
MYCMFPDLQVKDQSYTNPSNAALVQNYTTGTPVRVFRKGPGNPPGYAYEGLYKVIAHKMEKSSDGPKVGAGVGSSLAFFRARLLVVRLVCMLCMRCARTNPYLCCLGSLLPGAA